MNDNANESAFPCPPMISPGLTKREMIAAMALQGLLASDDPNKPATAEIIAGWAMECADALLTALSKEVGE